MYFILKGNVRIEKQAATAGAARKTLTVLQEGIILAKWPPRQKPGQRRQLRQVTPEFSDSQTGV